MLLILYNRITPVMKFSTTALPLVWYCDALWHSSRRRRQSLQPSAATELNFLVTTVPVTMRLPLCLPANCMTQLHTMSPVMLIMWDPPPLLHKSSGVLTQLLVRFGVNNWLEYLWGGVIYKVEKDWAVRLEISTHRMPLVQSKRAVGTRCCVITNKFRLLTD